LLSKVGNVITIISGILVIGGFIFGADYLKDYINKEVGTTKEVVLENTRKLEENQKLLIKRVAYLKEIRDYYIDRLN